MENSMDFLISSCVFNPKPLASINRFSLQAYSNSPTLSICRSVQIICIFLGPKPFMLSISKIPSGVMLNIASSSSNEPVSANFLTFSAVLFPIPGWLLISSKEAVSSRKGNLSNLKDALAIAFIRKGFSLCNSISWLHNLNFLAIVLLSILVVFYDLIIVFYFWSGLIVLVKD
ncbi:hypothetical protein D3C87_1195710 [compost metagenome]